MIIMIDVVIIIIDTTIMIDIIMITQGIHLAGTSRKLVWTAQMQALFSQHSQVNRSFNHQGIILDISKKWRSITRRIPVVAVL